MRSIFGHRFRKEGRPCTPSHVEVSFSWNRTRLLFAFSAVCFLLAAQNQPGADPVRSNPKPDGNITVPTIKTTVRQVLVPVVVTNKKGHLVSNLQQSDFTVFEDEVPQQIVAFRKTYDASLEQLNSPVAGSAAVHSTVVSPAKVGPDSPTRTYLVCVDTLHSSFGNVAQARRALTKFFQQEHDSQAQYALMNLSRQIEVIQDSTRDPSLVLSALASKKFQSSVLDGESSNIAWASEQLRRMLQTFSPQTCHTPVDPKLGTISDSCLTMKQRVKAFINTSAERTALLTRAFLQELKMIVNATGDMPTERTLILISDGFNLVPGRELFGIASSYFPEDPEWRLNERDTQLQLDELLRLAQKQNVIVYALDLRGVYSPTSQGGTYDAASSAQGDWRAGQALNEMDQQANTVAWEQGSAMAQLAAATGGLYFHDNNDLLSGIRRAFEEGRERYLIAYSPSRTVVDGKYRKIRVAVNDKGLHIRAKTGYWATRK